MPIDALFEKTQTLIRYASEPPESRSADKESITREISSLVDSARTGDEDAVELLLNLSAGSRRSEVAPLAEKALLQLYSDSDTLPTVRKTIASQACKLFEASEAAKARSAEKPAQDSISSSVASSAPTFHLKVPVLYLAGQHAHKSNYPALKTQINETLKNRCFAGADVAEASGEADLLTRGRFVRSEELLAATGGLRSLPVHGQCLELNPPAGGTSFASQIQSIRNAVSTEKKPRAVFVNTGAHWVTMVLFPVKILLSNLVDVVIVDTNQQAPRSASPVRKAVQDALGSRFSQPMQLLGGAMQTHVPNACGALSVGWVRALDQFMTRNPEADFGALTGEIRQGVKSWGELDSAAQDGRVTALRGELLANLDHH